MIQGRVSTDLITVRGVVPAAVLRLTLKTGTTQTA